ncbi:Ribonuclease H-like domain [Phytophthora cactorum]|nr:Ribonuclease H-like domain [Phytophthora cactorum]
MSADQQQRGPGIDGMRMNYPIDEAAFPSTPYSAAQVQSEQMQMQFQQQLQAQQQQMNQLQMQQSNIMEDIGPASSTLMQMHGRNTSAEMQMPNAVQLEERRDGDHRGRRAGIPQLYKTSKMRRPELWQFIRLVVPDPPHIAAGRTYTNQDAKEAYCLKCKRIMHYNTGSSNNVSRHMAKFHAADLASYAQKMAAKKVKNKKQQHSRTAYVPTNMGGSGSTSPGTGHKRRRTEATTPNSEGTTGSSITTQSPIGTPRLSLDELRATGDDFIKEELTQEETEQLNAIVARWVAKHHHPFTITEDPSCRSCSISPRHYANRSSFLRRALYEPSEVLFYSMASEVWITAERDIFVSFSIHYLTENFERRHFTIDVREHSGHQVYSYETKKEMLYTLIARWNLDPRYLSSMLWQSQPRVDTIANNPMQPRTQQAESAATGFEIMLAPCCMAPESWKRMACSKLMAGTSQQRLVTDSKASWLSTLDMLKRLVKKRDVIHDFFAYVDTSEGRTEFQNVTSSSSPSAENSGMQRQEPTDEQWCAIECLLQLLQPFENVALAIGKEKYAASSLTFPLLKFLKRDLEKVTNFQRVFAKYSGSQGSVQGGTENQPSMEFQAQTQNIATQLETYLSDEEREVCKARLIDQCFVLANFNQVMANQRLKASAAVSADITVSAGLDPSSATFLDFQTGMQPTREDHDTNSFLRELLFDDAHDDPALVYQQQQQQLLHQQGQLGDLGPVSITTGEGPTSPTNAATSAAYLEQEAALRARVVNEVKTYFDAVAIAKVTAMRDPLKWWRDNTAMFPLLVPLARQWLSSVGSVRPSDVVQISAGTHGDLTTTSTTQGVQVNATTGAALPYAVGDGRQRGQRHPPRHDLEVPTLAIDLVSIEINTSVMTDEFLAHRLGMIPLNFDGGLENFRQRFVYSQDCDCDENCPNCSVEFTLDVTADSGVSSVTSEDLKSSDPYIRPVNFSSEEELNNTQDTGVIIAKLGPGQRLRLSAIAKLGIGKEHAKWSPVAVATYMYDPIITLNQAVLSTYTPEQKAELYKSCPTEVFETDESYEQFTVGDAMRCMYCDECVKLADSFKDNPEDDSAVSIRMREDKFIFSVETTGQLKPEEVVICALDLIREKLSSLKHQCLELSQDDQGSSAPITPFG